MESLIQKIRDKKPLNEDHIAEITGVSWVPRSDYYRNRESGEEFYNIAGAIAWPAGDRAGFGIIVGVLKGGDPQEPTLKVLEEAEAPSVGTSLKACLQLRKKWGFPDLLEIWLGDYVRFAPVITDFNAKCRPEDLFIISAPYDFEKPNRSEIYLQRINELLRPGESGEKRLFLGNCERLRGYLRDLPHDALWGGQIEQWPAVAALGYSVHHMLVYKPWLRSVEPQKLISTVSEDELLNRPLHEQQEILRELNLLWEEDESNNDRDDGRLISTL